MTLTLAESGLAAALVFIGMLIIGQPWPVALLLGAIAVETGAASTLMVIRENNSAGPFTEALTGVIGLNNIFALGRFTAVPGRGIDALVDGRHTLVGNAALLTERGIDVSALAATGAVSVGGIGRALFPLFWQLVGSAALGFLVGLLLASWASQVVESGEILILLIGCVLLTVGVSTVLGLSPLVASLAVGATMANLSGKSRRLFAALSRTDPPLYVIFFVLAGADLDLSLLPSLGLLGLVYVLCRATGKLAGARLAAKRTRFPEPVQRLLGMSIFAQAGLAVGLVLVTRQRFPDIAPTVTTVVLGAVIVFEIAGPLSARFALDRSGESRPQEVQEAGQLLPLDEASP